MHGSLIDSHHRSSLSSNGPGILSSSEHSLADGDSIVQSSDLTHPIVPSSGIHLKRTTNGLDDVIEHDDDDKEPTASIRSHSEEFFRWVPGHRRVMLTFCTICLFAFMTGVEYAVILPTAFDYVKTMTKVDIYVGLVLSSYSISGSIAGIVLGRISDKTGKVKLLILVTNVFEVIGNILYFVTKDIRVVLLGRLIAGVGMGAVPPILADVAHRTSENDRTKAISIILGCRQLGLLIGPCFTLLIRKMDFYIGSIHINKLNGPGFLMATVWLVLQIVCWFCFYDRLPAKKAAASLSNGNGSDEELKHNYKRSDHRLRQEEEQQRGTLSLKTYREQYLRVEMCVLFLATFITYFNQTALETIVAAFTEENFKWTSVHTSILFAFAGLEIIIVYVLLIKVLSKRFQDRILLIFGFVSLTLACALGTFFTWGSHSFSWSTRSGSAGIDKRLMSMFIIFVFLDLMGLPFIAATSVSLFTKLTNKNLQGFSQGIQRFVMGIGTIVGPLFASLLLTRLHIMMTTMLGLTILTLIAIVIVIKRLRPPAGESSSANLKAADTDRSSSLEDDSDGLVSALALSSKKSYIALVQQDDEQNACLLNRNSKQNAVTKLLSNNNNTNNNSNGDLPTSSLRYDTSSTNIICESDEQHRVTREMPQHSTNKTG